MTNLHLLLLSRFHFNKLRLSLRYMKWFLTLFSHYRFFIANCCLSRGVLYFIHNRHYDPINYYPKYGFLPCQNVNSWSKLHYFYVNNADCSVARTEDIFLNIPFSITEFKFKLLSVLRYKNIVLHFGYSNKVLSNKVNTQDTQVLGTLDLFTQTIQVHDETKQNPSENGCGPWNCQKVDQNRVVHALTWGSVENLSGFNILVLKFEWWFVILCLSIFRKRYLNEVSVYVQNCM